MTAAPRRSAVGLVCCNTRDVFEAVSEARQLIRIVADDSGLPSYARRAAAGLEPLAASRPAVALYRLEELRGQVVPDLPSWPPICDYARCVPVDTFWDYHIQPSRRDMFEHGEDYRRHLEDHADPAAIARLDLHPDEVLVPASHSWLVPADRIVGISGARTKSLLKIDHEPPYLLMIFPVATMRTAGVAVREPRGVDAVPKRLTQWSAGDVPGERIDADIPLAALGSLQWQP